MSSIDNPSSYPFICPALRTNIKYFFSPYQKKWFQKKEISESTYLIIENSYHVFDAEVEKFSNSHKKVLQSHHLRLLPGRNNKEGEGYDFYCAACNNNKIGTTYYYCNDCNNHYHKECVESPPTFISPCYPKYPLQLLKYCWGNGPECHSCGSKSQGLVYYSSTCDIFLDPICATKREFSTINNPKRHEHILHYFPRKASLTCDVCATDDNKKCFYSCHQCDFIVHRKCIDLPHVILISCHNHRLCFTNTLPLGNWSCGVCRRKIDENYGSYVCTKSCAYAVHTKCTTKLDVWAGKELEDQPEMVYDDIEPFEEIGDGIIRHFSHAHHRMRLIEDIERNFDAKQQYCQACILSLYDGNVYTCMECDFVFHEACANLPRIKHIVVHPHRLILKPVLEDRYFFCIFCTRFSCGFRYMCDEECFDYCLDVRCATLYELVDHPSHPHPLFLFYERTFYQTCSACEIRLRRNLNCVECDFVLCFRCASLPYKVKYEHDEHMLTLSYEKNASGPCWCQVCEKTTYAKEGYYKCNECGVTFHSQCILGKDLYMKEGKIFYSEPNLEIIPNNRLGRSICKKCRNRCQYKIVFITSDGDIYCSASEIL